LWQHFLLAFVFRGPSQLFNSRVRRATLVGRDGTVLKVPEERAAREEMVALTVALV